MIGARASGEVSSGPAPWQTLACWLVLILAPLLVFHPIAFGGFTFARAAFAGDSSVTSGGSDTLPVLDPGAAASQDESWLVLLRRALARAEIPLVNLDNGLGAPLLESLQPGVLYPGNLALLLAPDAPALLDVFFLLHVALLLAGLFVLFRLHARPPWALAAALVVGLSGVTYQHVDMVHYRSLAWMPWALAAATHVARGSARARHGLQFGLAHAASIAAGALQEAFLGSLAIATVFALELGAAPASARERWRRIARMAALALASTLLAAPAFVPYLVARARGDLFTQATAERSLEGVAGDEWLTLLVPHAHGLAPHLLRLDRPLRWLTDFATAGAFLVVLAACAVVVRRRAERHRFALGLAAVVLLAALKLQHVPAFDFVGALPFLREILYVKYHLGLYVLLGLLAAVGLGEIERMEDGARRRAVLAAGVVLALLLGAGAAWVATSSSWRSPADLPAVARRELLRSTIASLAGCAACIALLWRLPRAAPWGCVLAIVASAAFVAPDGWFRREPAWRIPPALQRLADLPRTARVLTSLPPNQNLVAGFESLSLFDPVHAAGLHHFLPTYFHVESAGFALHPVRRPDGLKARELDAARLLSVTHVHGHPLPADAAATDLGDEVHALEGTLPRVFLLSTGAAAEIEARSRTRPHAQTVAAIRAELARTPRARDVDIGSRAVSFTADGAHSGVLVVSQACLSGWTLAGRSARPFLRTLCAWDVELAPDERVTVSYWPPGLTPALGLAGLGALVAAGWLARSAISRSSSARNRDSTSS